MNKAAVVLAGGQSSRMGKCKAFLEFEGKLLIDHMCKTLEQTGFDNIYISGDLPGYDCIPDEGEALGPAFAIQNIFQSLPTYEGILFVPVDMPLLSTELLHRLVTHSGGAFFKGYPLPAFIMRSEELKAVNSVRALLSALATFAIDLPKSYEAQMLNINTPEDFEKIQSL